jgi:hypothetical protein
MSNERKWEYRPPKDVRPDHQSRDAAQYPESRYEDVLATADILPLNGGSLCGNLAPPNRFSFVDASTAKAFLTIGFDPPFVEVDPDLNWNTAAKQFWNAVYRMAGKPALFPEL